MPELWEQDEVVATVGNPYSPLLEDEPLSTDEVMKALRPAAAEYYARGRLKESAAPNLLTTGVGMGASAASPVMRATGIGDADEAQRLSEAFSAAAAERDVERYKAGETVVPPIVARAVRGAAQTVPSMVVGGAVAGPYGAIGLAGVQELDRSITDAKDAGLEGEDVYRYALTQGAIEAGVAAAFQRLGLGGLESAAAQPIRGGVRQGLREALKSGAKSTLQEIPEEIITELGHNVASAVSGVDPNATTPEALQQTVADTVVQTIFGGSMVAGPPIAAAGVKRLAELKALRAKGPVSRTDGRKLGIDDPKQEDRTRRVDQEIQTLEEEMDQAEARFNATVSTLEQETQDASTIPSPEAEVRQEQGRPYVRGSGQEQVRPEQAGQVAPAPEVQVAPKAAPTQDEISAAIAEGMQRRRQPQPPKQPGRTPLPAPLRRSIEEAQARGVTFENWSRGTAEGRRARSQYKNLQEAWDWVARQAQPTTTLITPAGEKVPLGVPREAQETPPPAPEGLPPRQPQPGDYSPARAKAWLADAISRRPRGVDTSEQIAEWINKGFSEGNWRSYVDQQGHPSLSAAVEEVRGELSRRLTGGPKSPEEAAPAAPTPQAPQQAAPEPAKPAPSPQEAAAAPRFDEGWEKKTKAVGKTGTPVVGTNFHYSPPGVQFQRSDERQIATKLRDTGLLGFWFYPTDQIDEGVYGPFRSLAKLDIRNPVEQHTPITPEEWSKIGEGVGRGLPSNGRLAERAEDLGMAIEKPLGAAEWQRLYEETKPTWGQALEDYTGPMAENKHGVLPTTDNDNQQVRQAFTEVAKASGYDGYHGHDQSWVPFTPEQIQEIERVAQPAWNKRRGKASVEDAYRAYGLEPPKAETPKLTPAELRGRLVGKGGPFASAGEIDTRGLSFDKIRKVLPEYSVSEVRSLINDLEEQGVVVFDWAGPSVDSPDKMVSEGWAKDEKYHVAKDGRRPIAIRFLGDNFSQWLERATPSEAASPEAATAPATETSPKPKKKGRKEEAATAVETENASEPEFRDWRFQSKTKNSGRIVPNKVGRKFTPEQLQSLVAWTKSRGLDVLDVKNTGFRVVGKAGERLDLSMAGAAGVKAEQAEAASAQKKAEEKERRQTQQDQAAGRASAPWIASTFGEAMNAFNRNALSDFVEGVTPKFEGMVSSQWRDGLEKIGAATEKGVDWNKVKAAYETSQKAETTPELEKKEPAKPAVAVGNRGQYAIPGMEEDAARIEAREEEDRRWRPYVDLLVENELGVTEEAAQTLMRGFSSRAKEVFQKNTGETSIYLAELLAADLPILRSGRRGSEESRRNTAIELIEPAVLEVMVEVAPTLKEAGGWKVGQNVETRYPEMLGKITGFEVVDGAMQARVQPSDGTDSTTVELTDIVGEYTPEVEPALPAELPTELGAVYEATVGGKRRFAVREFLDNPRGGGDSLFDTREQAEKEGERAKRRHAEREEYLEKEKQAEEAEKRAKEEEEGIDGFGDDLPDVQRRRIIHVLTTKTNYRGTITSRRNLIRKLIKEGHTVQESNRERRLTSPDGETFLSEKSITKIAMDYAEWLQNKPADTTQTAEAPAPVPPADLPLDAWSGKEIHAELVRRGIEPQGNVTRQREQLREAMAADADIEAAMDAAVAKRFGKKPQAEPKPELAPDTARIQPLTERQRYRIASSLATSKPEQVIERMKQAGMWTQEAAEWIERIRPFYKKLDGFVPQRVLDLIKSESVAAQQEVKIIGPREASGRRIEEAKSPAAKDPWEMTQGEYLEADADIAAAEAAMDAASAKDKKRAEGLWRKRIADAQLKHKNSVADAVRSGKAVSEKVLEPYASESWAAAADSEQSEVMRIADKLIQWKQGERLTDPENFRSSWAGYDDAKQNAIVSELVERGELPIGFERRKTVTASQILEELSRRLASARYKTRSEQAAERKEAAKERFLDAARRLADPTKPSIGLDPAKVKDAIDMALAALDYGVASFDEFVSMALGAFNERWVRDRAAYLEEAARQAGIEGVTSVSDVLNKPPEPPKGKRPPPLPSKRRKESGDPVTSIKNEIVNELRERRGLPELPGAEAQSQQEWLDRAEEILADDPQRGDRIVKEINKNPRNLSNTEVAVMQIHYRRLNNQLEESAERLFDAHDRGDSVEAATALADVDHVMAALAEVEDATKAAGREWGRAGVARQITLARDFSLAGMMRRARVANAGAPLSAEQQAEIAAMARKIQELEGKLSQFEQERDDRERERRVDEGIAEDKKRAKRTGRKAAARKKVDDAWAEFEALAKDKLYTTPVELAIPAAKLVSAYVELGVASFAEFMANVSQRIGADAAIKSYDVFRTAWDDAKAKGEIPIPEIDSADLAGITRLARRIQRALVESGVTNRDAVVDAVHESLLEFMPEITRRETMDALSGYGQFTPLSQDEIDRTIRDINGQLQQLAKLEDMAAGKAPAKTGPERRTPSDEERRLIKQVNEAKKRGGFNVTDPEQQLKSALDAAKTAVKNRIADLEHEIRTQERIVRQRTELKPDAELTALRKQRDALLAAHRELFPKPQATEAQKIASASRALDKAIEGLEQQLKAGDVAPKKRLAPISTPELDAKRARLKALREQRDALRALANPKMTPEERATKAYKANLTKRIADYQQRIANKEFDPRPKKEPRKLDPQELKLKKQLEDVKHEFFEKAAEYRLANMSPGERAWDYAKETAHLSRAAMTSIDLSAVFRQGGPAVFAHPALAAKAGKEMLKALASRQAEFNSVEEIRNRPNGQLYETARLSITEDQGKLTRQEEAYMGRWAKKVPGVAASSRAYSTFLNNLRADLFDQMVENLGRGGQVTLDEAKVIARYVNVATGRADLDFGKFGNFNQAAADLNMVFFAPRYVASRFQYLAMPFYLPFTKTSGRVKKLIAAEYARHAVGVTTFLGLAVALASLLTDDDDEKPTVELDPRSSDFLKLKIGETRIDPMSGLSQVVVVSARVLGGKTKTDEGEVKPIRGPKRERNDPTTSEVMGRFLRSKLAPIPGAAWTTTSVDWETGIGEDFVGNEIPFIANPLQPSIVRDLFVPLSLREVKDTMQARGIPAGTAISILGLLGMGLGTYGPKTRYRAGTPEERMEQFDTDLKNMQWDSPDPAYSEFLSEDQLEQVRRRREERKQSIILMATLEPDRENYKSDDTFDKAVESRDKARKTLLDTGWSHREAQQHLLDHYQGDKSDNDYWKKFTALAELYGLNENAARDQLLGPMVRGFRTGDTDFRRWEREQEDRWRQERKEK